MALDKIHEALRAFFAKHPKERFYALIIDANSIGLSSEEAFEKRRQDYAATWLADLAPFDLEALRKLSAEELEEKCYDVHRLVKGTRRRAAMVLEDAVAEENRERAEKLAAGNPYESSQSEDWRSLRDSTATYGELVSPGLGKEYRAHYDMNDEDQKTSEYAKTVRDVIRQLEANHAELFRGVELTADFRIQSKEHGY